jgi:Fic family protein
MNLIEKLKLILELKQITQTQLAQALGVSHPTINSWLNGKSLPHQEKIRRIDQLLLSLGISLKNLATKSLASAKEELVFSKQKILKSPLSQINQRPDLYKHLLLSLTYNTNSIEGSTLSENETAAVLFDGAIIKNKDLIEHLEAKNHQAAFEFLLEQMNQKAEIGENLILELHKKLMNGIRPDAGFYRQHGVRILGANVPTANYLKIPELMKELIKNISNPQNDYLMQVTQIHSDFEKIHPFSDGNGRIGRLLMAAMLLQKNFPPAIILKTQKMIYYSSLQQAQIHNNFQALKELIIDSILKTYSILLD